ncbi:MAG: DUF3800 domain-containing protein [Acidobacteriia bacterium]|nr:DUF3800 domain-containing protein [Terriglobia bacterium]
MSVIVFLDEAGNLNLDLQDEDFPLFAVTLLICNLTDYTRSIVPAFLEFKIKHFGHEAVILHSRDIRKAQKEFGFLTNRERREAFLQELTALMRDLNYRWITTVIRKQRHREIYGAAARNPYDLALTFCLERLLPLLEEEKQAEVCLLAEARGKTEDKELELSFLRTVSNGTYYIPADRFRAVKFTLSFAEKRKNVTGNQMADLIVYPIARHVLDPAKPNLPYEVLGPKEYKGPGWVRGLKVFP